MKRIKTILWKVKCCFAAVICCAAITGCIDGDKYNKMFVKDKDGNIYQLKWNIGDLYFINKQNIPAEWK